MKYIPFLLFIVLYSFSSNAQETKFKEVEEKIKSLMLANKWDDILLLAPDLIVEAPTKGDGFYYTAYAFLMLKDLNKAKEYMDLAETLSDDDLNLKLQKLKSQLNVAGGADRLLENAKKLQNKGENKSSAEEWKKLWEIDKSKTEYALNAIELFIEGKHYPEALEILADNTIKADQNATKLFQRINQTPEMNKINGYNSAMEDGKRLFSKGYFKDASNKFNIALGFKPTDNDASDMKAKSEDENAWNTAVSSNTIPSYEKYIARSVFKKYDSKAVAIIKSSLLFYGEKAAKENNVANMEYYLNKYLKDFPRGEDINRINTILCSNYARIADENSILKDVFSQQTAIDNYSKAKKICFKNDDFDKKLRIAQKLKTRYGRPDRYFVSYVYDKAVPIGVSMGTINNTSIGFFLLGRINDPLLSSYSGITTNNKGEVTGETGSYSFSGTKSLGTGEIEIGITKKITFPFWVYAGGGVSFNQEHLDFKSSSGQQIWVKNTDNKKTNAIFDAGLILDVGGFNIRGGGKTSDFKSVSYSVGIGFSL